MRAVKQKSFVFVLTALVLVLVPLANAQETKLKWFGHAAFAITTPRGTVLLIDPWLSNPSNPDVKAGKDLATFAGITQNADAFLAELKKLRIPSYEMRPGETISFRGRSLRSRR